MLSPGQSHPTAFRARRSYPVNNWHLPWVPLFSSGPPQMMTPNHDPLPPPSPTPLTKGASPQTGGPIRTRDWKKGAPFYLGVDMRQCIKSCCVCVVLVLYYLRELRVLYIQRVARIFEQLLRPCLLSLKDPAGAFFCLEYPLFIYAFPEIFEYRLVGVCSFSELGGGMTV